MTVISDAASPSEQAASESIKISGQRIFEIFLTIELLVIPNGIGFSRF
jgi:hypothetical protein